MTPDSSRPSAVPGGAGDAQGVQVHGTVVAIGGVGGVGVLLRGPSGCGKSDLALRLIDGGAALVADDRADIRCVEGALIATPPPAIAGRMEVRGIGIVEIDTVPRARLGLLIDLVPAARIARIPDATSEDVLGITLPLIAVTPFEASAAAKVRLAAARAGGGIMGRP